MRAYLKNSVTVFPVKDITASITWYNQWLEKPDIVPIEGMAEYQLTDTAWLQLSQEEGGEFANIILGVEDIAQVREELFRKGLEPSEIVDWQVVLVCDLQDPDGNRISFAQEVEM